MGMMVSDYSGMLCFDAFPVYKIFTDPERLQSFLTGISSEYGTDKNNIAGCMLLGGGRYLMSCTALALTRTAIGFLCRWNSMVWTRDRSISARELAHHIDMTMLLQDVVALGVAAGLGYSYMPFWGLAMFAGFNFTSMIVNGDILSDFASDSILVQCVGFVNTVLYMCMLPMYQYIEFLDSYVKDKTKHGTFGKSDKQSSKITYSKNHCVNVNLVAIRDFLGVHVYGESVKSLFERYAGCIDDKLSQEWSQFYLKNTSALHCIAEDVGVRFGKHVMSRVVNYLGERVCTSDHVVEKNNCVYLDKKRISDVVQADGLKKELRDAFASFAKIADVDRCLKSYKLNMSPAIKEEFIKLLSDACRDRIIIDARKAVLSVCCDDSEVDPDYSQDIDRYLVDNCIATPLVSTSADINISAAA